MAKQNPGGGQAIVPPFMGLYLDRPPHIIPPTGLQACNNVRIHQNQITNKAMGWLKLAGPLNGPICGGTLFATVLGKKYFLVATPSDVYVLNITGATLVPTFITPVYTTGTAAASGTAVTGAGGTLWNTSIGSSWRKNARPGDQISFGSATQNDPTATWFTVATVTDNTHLVLTASAGTIGAGVYTLRQCLASDTEFARMRFEEYIQAGTPDNGDIVMGVNGGGNLTSLGGVVTSVGNQDPMFKWNPVNTFGTYLSTLAFTGTSIRRFQNVMVVGNLRGPGMSPTFQPFSIASSDNGLPISFSTGVAFQGFVADTPYFIAHLGILGNSLMIYGGGRNIDGTVVSAQFAGFPTIWQFSTVVRGHGTFGPDTICEFPDRHEFIHYAGQYRFNGLFIQVMNDHIWRNLVQSMSIQRIGNSVCIPAHSFGDVIWALPLKNDTLGEYQGGGLTSTFSPAQYGFVEHYMEQPSSYLFKPYTMRDAPFTAYIGSGADNQIFTSSPGPIVGDANGNIFQLYTNDLQDGTPFSAWCQFADRVVAGERSRGLIKRVYPQFTSAADPAVAPVLTLSASASPLPTGVYRIINGTKALDGTQAMVPAAPFVNLATINGSNLQQWTWTGTKFANTVLGQITAITTGGYMTDNNDGTVSMNTTGDTWTVTTSGQGFIIQNARTSNFLGISGATLAMGGTQTVWQLTDPPSDFNITVQLRMKDRVGGPVTITDSQTLDALTPANRFTTHYRRGRVGSVAFSSDGGTAGTPWTLYGYDWDLPARDPGGQR